MANTTRPFKPFQVIFEQEMEQAREEQHRPLWGLAASALIAGIGIGVGPLLMGTLKAAAGDEVASLSVRLLSAALYSIGFILVILARTDLFTEYTTIAILPYLGGRSSAALLLRLWGAVLAFNLLGAFAFSALAAHVGVQLKVLDRAVLVQIAHGLLAFPAWVMFLSAVLAGWLMGLLSWLVTAARDTTSQVAFIFFTAFTISFAHLHHSIAGFAEVLMPWFVSDDVSLGQVLRFVLWSTPGNIVGGALFAATIHVSILLGGQDRGRGQQPPDGHP